MTLSPEDQTNRFLVMNSLVSRYRTDIASITAALNDTSGMTKVRTDDGKAWTEESVRSYLRGAGLLRTGL